MQVTHLDWAALLDVEIIAKASRLFEIPCDDPHLPGGGLQRGGNRPRGSAGPDDRDATGR
jgi:hypothetical protein